MRETLHKVTLAALMMIPSIFGRLQSANLCAAQVEQQSPANRQ